MSIDPAQFHEIFFEESFEGLDIMETGLLDLDLGAADAEAINTIFRAAHSIKGGSGTFGFMEVSDFTHAVETLLDEMRDGRRSVTREAVDLLLASVDCIREMLTAVKAGNATDAERVAEMKRQLDAMLHASAESAPNTEEAATPDTAEAPGGFHIHFRPFAHLLRTGNDPVHMFRELGDLGELEVKAHLDDLPPLIDLDPEACYLSWALTLAGGATKDQVAEVFDWVEGDCELEITPIAAEPVAAAVETESASGASESAPAPAPAPVPPAADRRVGDRRGSGDRRKPAAGKDAGSIRVAITKVDSLINMVGELVITQSMLSQLSDQLENGSFDRLRDGLEQLERNTRELQESVMQIRMLPISFSFNRFPRLVHDLSGKLGKQIELRLSGEQTELDKTVMEKIGDPLVHLVRNSLDHGIEMPEARRAAGKPEVGTVHMNAYHQGGNIVIEITDDGAGIDADRVLAKARDRGIVAPDEVLPEERIYDLIFQPGFSTAEQVSDVSGRGVGMDVVRRNIKDLGGTVEVRSSPGEGSTFTIRLPLTLAILDGQLVRVGQETFIVPLVSIVESLQVREHQVNAIAGRAELYKLREEYIPIVRLYDLFELTPDSTELQDGLIVVVESEGQKVGIFVDELQAQQQVVIKSLETNFRRVEGISGATILGDGTVSLILDVAGLVELSRCSRRHAAPDKALAA